MTFERELSEASEIAREAGRLVLDLYDRDIEVELKGANDPVTLADRRANEHIVNELRKRFPSDGIVAEETADRSEATRFERCWYVDPLDGTKEFIAKNGEFAVMIGLSVGGRSRAGVVYQPVSDKLFRGAVGEGAELVTNGGTTPLRVSELDDPSALTLVVSRSHRSSKTDRIAQALGITNELRSGSVGLKIGIVAERIADLYVHVSDKSSLWDTCGPEAILRGAGGRFTDVAGDEFRYDVSEMRTTRGILACNDKTYARVLEVVREVARDTGFLGA
jgi:3'(2'), 5'-bisphosphate nucleotidase